MAITLDHKPAFDPANVKDFGTAKIEHRTAASGLNQLGTYFMTFQDATLTDPWTVQYEETIYVIEGQARLVIIDGDREQTILGDADELLVLPQGTTVRYGARPGTRLLLSITPVNWRDISTAV
jgi:ethanolamine utilization protein EutQ (cupin superfamily)